MTATKKLWLMWGTLLACCLVVGLAALFLLTRLESNLQDIVAAGPTSLVAQETAAAVGSLRALRLCLSLGFLTLLLVGSGLAYAVGRGIGRTEQTLREAGAYYRHLVGALPAAVYTTDREGRITLFNERAAELWGRRPKLGADLWCGAWRLFRPDGSPLPPAQCPMGAAVRAGRSIRGQEILVERPDGVRSWVLPHPEPLRNVAGELVGAVNLLVDITDRKQAEAALRENEERFRLLAETVPSIVWTAAADGRITYANRRWHEYGGRPAEQTVPFCHEQLVHPEDRQRCSAQWAMALQSGQEFEIEVRNRRQDGAYRWFITRAVPLRSAEGQVLSWFGVTTDIHDQKLSQQELREADRRKDEFLAVLSHELRNPLAPIRNALQILRLGQLTDPDLVEAREVIDRQVQQLAGIVNDLLDVFRIMHQKVRLQKEPLDLAQLVRQAAEDYRSALEGNRRLLELEVPAEAIWVQGDHRRLCQATTNLLQNASKYTNPGDRVRVRMTVDEAEQRVAVTVEDTGIGIAAELLPRIFETFTQGEQQLDRQRGGLGLGLPLVRGIVELHGGGVQASSAGAGQGAALTFWLPLGRPPRTIPRDRVALVPNSRQLRILIVEDNGDTARSLAKLLTRFGHEVALAHTGPTGLALAHSWRPEVILCDLGLPELDGYDVALALRSDPATAHVRLIAVSGYGQDEDRRRTREVGFDLHLTKPVDPVELERLLAVVKVDGAH